ncbi:hypothetical protein [Legionella feeleii]|nr:hypothetical protein [Legionella feeleii]
MFTEGDAMLFWYVIEMNLEKERSVLLAPEAPCLDTGANGTSG